MYHGVLQHKTYVTSYLRRHIEHRDLETPLHMGRIYRIVPEGRDPLARPGFEKAEPGELVAALAHRNGWVRDTAQRLLVDRGLKEAGPALLVMARGHESPLARLHALWTLEGLEELDAPTVNHALQDTHPRVRVAALRLAEPFLRVLSDSPEVRDVRSQFLGLRQDDSREVRMQLALSLGDISYGPVIKKALAEMQGAEQEENVRRLAGFSLALREPKKETVAQAKPKGRPLTEKETARFNLGKEIFEITCIACHQQHGLGQEGLAPPLVDSEWVSGSEERLARIVLHGLSGPITVKGEVYEIDMPSLAVLDDQQIAAVLTYIRREWGHSFEPVEPELVEKVRALTGDRLQAWTEQELLKIE
jgi:mono/diheme cytochrome c family protein